MASRQLAVPEFGKVTLIKRKGARTIRLSVDHSGQLRISLPQWASYQTGLNFAKAQSTWVLDRQRELKPRLINGQAIGKAHHLCLIADPAVQKVSQRLKITEALVRFPAHLDAEHDEVQQAAQKVSLKALRAEAEQLLPTRLAQLAKQHNFGYKSVRIRHLKSRWGSCNANSDITLNLFLMQLPWQLIDYVLLHELVHTKVLRHGSPFWQELTLYSPQAKVLRRQVASYRPNFSSMT